MSNPTTGNESQFKPPFNILPDFRLSNPTRIVTNQFNPPFDILPNRNLMFFNPTKIVTTQFNADLGNNSWSTTNNINDSDTQFFNSNPTRKESLSDFINPSQFSQRNSDRNIRLTTRAFPVESSNIDGDFFKNKGIALAGSVLGGVTGLTTVTAGGVQSIQSGIATPYNTLPMERLRNTPGIKYQDFRTKLRIGEGSTDGEQVAQSIAGLKINGAAAALRNPSGRAAIFAASSIAPGGSYAVFNIKQTYGFGEHDDPGAIRSDFTMRSIVTTRWNTSTKQFEPTKKFFEKVVPFRGDKINVIDFKRDKNGDLNKAYKWLPSTEILGFDLSRLSNNDILKTQDFIKFYFTGPKIKPDKTGKDDIMVFRAIITSMDDSFNADWSSVQMIGRADPNYHYGSFSRGGSLSFDVYATDRDEMKPIYRKLNALASYTAPIYDSNTIAMKGPWMRLTVGDIHVQQPITLTSLTYNYDFDAPWEINLEDDPDMMQLPLKVSVTCNFNIVGNDIPQKDGRMLSLAKQYDSSSKAIQGDDNWLSDFKNNVPNPKADFDSEKSKNLVDATGNKLSEDQLTAISNAGNVFSRT